MSTALRVIIADDEPLARQSLRRCLTSDPGFAIVGEAEDLPGLRTILASQPAEVLFLDITMPGGSGFDALPSVPQGTAIVFTTAHAEYAAAAFDIDAVDYLVKPFGYDRVREALARVRRWHGGSVTRTAGAISILLVRTGSRLQPVPVADVWRFEGADDFVRVVTGNKTWLHGTTLATLAAQLDATTFVRVHRSHVVNLKYITRLVPGDERRLVAQFPDGTQVVCSRAGSTLLRQRARTVDR